MANELVKGEVRVGYLLDGVEDEAGPQASALWISPRSTIRLQMPVISPHNLNDLPELQRTADKTHEWLRNPPDSLPRSLVFQDPDGAVTLTDLSMERRRWNGVGEGVLGADVAILGMPKGVQDEYKVAELDSVIDGLHDFSGFRTWHWDEELAANEKDLVPLRRKDQESVEWKTDGFTFEIRSRDAMRGTPGRDFALQESSRLITKRQGGATVWEHYQAQRAIRALLILSYGGPLNWREHWIVDEQFPAWLVSGHATGPGRTKVLISSTLEEHEGEPPSRQELGFPAVRLAALEASNLDKWTSAYLLDDSFRSAVQPAVEAIAMRGTFMEPRIMMLAVALERFGYCGHGRTPVTMPGAIQWALDQVGLDWPEVGSREGLARFAANINNDLKHADRERSPSPAELHAALRLMIIAVRGQLLYKLEVSEEVIEQFADSPSVQAARRAFTLNQIQVNDQGKHVC